MEPVSVDEAFLDLTGTETLWGPPPRRCARIKARIRAETGLTASAGLAANKFVAKVASDLEEAGRAGGRAGRAARPRSWRRCRSSGCGAWARSRPKELEALGVTTIGQLQALRPAVLTARLGPHGADLLAIWPSAATTGPVEPFSPPKSMGAEKTFGRDCRDLARLEETLRGQAERVARELRAEGLAACRVTLKLRWADFRTLTRSHTGDPTQDGLEIYRRATTLLARERADPAGAAHRGVGVDLPARGARPAPAARPRRRPPRAAGPGRRPDHRPLRRSAIVPARLLDRPDALE